jgi:hypothetical protein
MVVTSSSSCGPGRHSQSPSPKRKPAGRELRRKTFGYSDARAKGQKELRTLGSNRAGGGEMLFFLFHRFLFGAIFFVSVGTIVLIGVFSLIVVVVALGI